jgi:spermidine/putrescine transport system substrate-binding protein
MASHPRERGPRPLSRRDFLRNSALAGAALSVGGSALLAACGSSGSSATKTTGSKTGGCRQPPKLSRQNDPATLPLCSDAIKDGLEPEGGTLKVFNYADYVGPDAVTAFEKQYKCKVVITEFDSMDDAVSKLQANTARFDVSNLSPDRIGSLAATETLQPINHSYIPNLAKNVWPSLQDPFYDKGSRYSVPYTLYTTGVGYRVDKIDPADDPYKLADGTDLLYNPKYKGRTSVLDDDREALSMALLRLGITDVNTEDPSLIDKAEKELARLIDLVNVKVDIQDYTQLPEGQSWVHQAWGGDMINAVSNLPKGVEPTVLGYWFQPDGKGLIQNDMLVIPKSAEHPVLAHHFLNFLLDPDNAILNFNGIGYQQPLNALDPDSFITKELVPANLKSAIVRPTDFDHAYEELQLSPAGDRLWQAAWRKFTSGA